MSYLKPLLAVLLSFVFSSCEKADDDVSLKDFYRCEANIKNINNDTWEIEMIEEVMILSIEFVAEDQFTVSKIMNLDYGDYYFPTSNSTYHIGVFGDSIKPINEMSTTGIVNGVFIEDKKYFNFTHFTYKLASDPSFGNPIWEPTEENFYCKKNY